MTEDQWNSCADPETMIRYLANVVWFPNRTSKRKKRLFATACCRRINGLDDRACQELETAEQYAERELSQEESEAASKAYFGTAILAAPWGLKAVLAAKAAGWGGASASAAGVIAEHAQ